MIFALLFPFIYSMMYMMRGANFQFDTWLLKILPKNKAILDARSVAEKEGRHLGYIKGFRLPISYAAMALMMALALDAGWLGWVAFFAAQWLAYQPAPDTVAKLLKRQKYHKRSGVNKFHHETMALRHAFSGLVLGLAGLYWSPWALLLIPAHILGGWLYKDVNYPEGERRLGLSVGVALMILSFLIARGSGWQMIHNFISN